MNRALTRRTAVMAILIPLAAGCAGGGANLVPGTQSYQQELRRVADATITPQSVLTNISVIADDSMGGRNTPSPGLDKTAEYFASKYREWGVEPMGDNGSYFQRYPLVKKGIDQGQAFFEVTQEGIPNRWAGSDYVYVTGGGTDGMVTGEIVMFGGALTPELIAQTPLAGKIAVVLYDAAKAVDWNRWQRAIRAQNPAAMVVMRNDDLEAFNRGRPTPDRMRMTLDRPSTSLTTVMVNEAVFEGDPVAENWPNFNQLRMSPEPVIQMVPPEVTMSVYAPEIEYERTTAPNVVGLIRGSDPALRNEYVVYSAHMDHVGTVGDGIGGCRPTGEDTICNGADDDASGSTGILLVAEAYAKLKVKPRRSIIILHVSAEEKGLWGSWWFSEHPTVPLDQIVADINYDMIGRNNPDSIVVIGKEHSDMGETLARVNAGHPELNLTTADDIWPDERFYFRSDHFNFARKGVPILFFFNGVHEDYHRATDHVEKIEYDKLSRVARIGFYLGAEIANTAARPQWNPESYREIVEQ